MPALGYYGKQANCQRFLGSILHLHHLHHRATLMLLQQQQLHPLPSLAEHGDLTASDPY
jgi:hypothetical protein